MKKITVKGVYNYVLTGAKNFIHAYKTEVSTKEKMSTKEIWSYSYGEFGRNAGRVGIDGYYFTIIMTLIMGVDPMVIAAMLATSNLIGLFKDPIISLLVDITHTKWGRFKPYAVIFMPLSCLLALAFICNPFKTGDEAMVPYLYATYILWGIIDGFATTGWNGLQKCITLNEQEKNKYFAIARGMSVASTFIPSAFPIFTDIFNYFEWPLRYLYLPVCIVLAFLGTFMCIKVKNLNERIVIPRVGNPFKNIKYVFKNKYNILMWAKAIPNIPGKLADYAAAYIFISCYGLFSLQTIVWTFAGWCAWIPLFFSKRVFKRLSTKSIMMFRYGISALCMLSLYFVGFGKEWYYIVMLIVLHMINAIFEYISAVSDSMINADIMNYTEYKFGIRNESTADVVGGLIIGKPFGALTSLIYGIVFTAIGFQSGTDVQSPETSKWLFLLYTLGGALSSALSFIIYMIYDLTGKKLAKMNKELAIRHNLEGKRVIAKEHLQVANTYKFRPKKVRDDDGEFVAQ